MPLVHARTPRTIKAAIPVNIRTEIARGHKPIQATAIALETARRDARRAHVRVKGIKYHRAHFHWKQK